MKDDFDWDLETDDSSIISKKGISVYPNNHNKIVIRQQNGCFYCEEDSFIVVFPEDVEKLINLLRKAKRGD